MERREIIICSVVGFLGLLSAALGFAAEGKRIKASQIQVTSATSCIYPSSPAMELGFTAALALLVAHIIVNVTTGCVCCRRGPHQPTANWTLALVCFVVSWFTFVIAFLLLLTGAALNDQHGEESMYFGNYYCYVVKPGVFAGASFLSLASVLLGMVYFLTLNKIKNTTTAHPPVNQGAGIAMGQPQFPPPNAPAGAAAATAQGPVFVHEDTYMRRQFT